MMKVYIMNISNQLKKLFFDYLERTEYDRLHPKPYSVNNPSYKEKEILFDDDFKGVIYFYEWSDVSRTPKSFYTMKAFEKFLEESNIFILGYQREIIRNMRNPYITCTKGEKELVIKSTYEALCNAMKNPNPFGSTGSPFYNPMSKTEEKKEPYSVAITRPKMVWEPDNRYPETMPQDMMPRQAHNREYWDW
jgi:hypothetical protein